MYNKIYLIFSAFLFLQIGFAQNPQILSVSPLRNMLNVSTDADISVTFDTDMNLATINDTTFVVNARYSGLCPGTISYNSSSRTATFDPDDNFVAGELVNIVLTTEIQSDQGMPLDSMCVWSFTVKTHFGHSTFLFDSTYSVGDEPWSIVSADLDGDGDLDLATANRNDRKVSVLLNNGNGKFSSSTSYSVDYWPHSIVASDLDRDGDVDLATANRTSGTVSVLMNNGNGTFATHINYDSGLSSISTFSADLNGNGFIDLMTANYYGDNLSILFNDGDGTFGPDTLYPVGGTVRSVVTADLNKDGNFDLVAATQEGNVAILFNDGFGNFLHDSSYSTGTSFVHTVFAADLDCDGNIDLVTSNSTSNNVSVFHNNGDGTFSSPLLYESGGNDPGGLSITDFDGDGNLDIGVINTGSDNVSILLNDGFGNFSNRLLFPVGANPTAICAADLDGDGDLDIAITHRYLDAVSVLLNRTIPPVITNISDIANDQGRQVRISWLKSAFDGAAGDSAVFEYSLWRRVDLLPENRLVQLSTYENRSFTDNNAKQSYENFFSENNPLPPGDWDFIQTIPAIGSRSYNVISPTLADSTIAHGIHWSVFAVIAHASNQLTFFVSEPDSGYSLDNLIPQVPKGIQSTIGDSAIELTWRMVLDDDLNYYAIYRSSQSGFHPNNSNLLATTVDTAYYDSEVLSDTTYYYRISAFDFAGNESQYSNEVSAILTGISDTREELPKSFSLFQNYPNPFNPITKIQYIVPITSNVKIEIFNISGQHIVTLVDNKIEPGVHVVRFDARKLASGLYIYRMQSKSFSATKRMLLIK